MPEKEWQPDKCNEKAGFLFSHECDRPPSAKCTHCTKPICKKHTTRRQDGVTLLCTACTKKAAAEDPGGSHSYSHDDPYYYGSHYYGDRYYDDRYDRRSSYDDRYSTSRRNDPQDFTEADSESLVAEADGDFENDMSES